MEKLTPPQQLSFQFESNQHEKPAEHIEIEQPVESLFSTQIPNNSVVINISDLLFQRNKKKEHHLYQQILNSVRHIG